MEKIFSIYTAILMNAELYGHELYGPKVKKPYHQIWEANLQLWILGSQLLSHINSILGSLLSFIVFEWWANQIGPLQAKKKLGRHLI